MSKKIKATWDIKTADKCKLPELIPDICEDCRDYDYCHRERTIFDWLKEGDDNGQTD